MSIISGSSELKKYFKIYIAIKYVHGVNWGIVIIMLYMLTQCKPRHLNIWIYSIYTAKLSNCLIHIHTQYDSIKTEANSSGTYSLAYCHATDKSTTGCDITCERSRHNYMKQNQNLHIALRLFYDILITTQLSKKASDVGAMWERWFTYGVFLRVADLDVEEVIEQPVDRLVAVEHEEELDHFGQVARLEQFAYSNSHKSCATAAVKPRSYEEAIESFTHTVTTCTERQ